MASHSQKSSESQKSPHRIPDKQFLDSPMHGVNSTPDNPQRFKKKRSSSSSSSSFESKQNTEQKNNISPLPSKDLPIPLTREVFQKNTKHRSSKNLVSPTMKSMFFFVSPQVQVSEQELKNSLQNKNDEPAPAPEPNSPQKMFRLLRLKTIYDDKSSDEEAYNKNMDKKINLTRQASFLSRKNSITQIPWWILLPHGYFKQIWNIILLLTLIYTAIFMPFKIAFIEDNQYPEWDIFDYFIDGIFLFDVLINFFAAYQDEFNNLITNHKLIMKKYLKGWFLIDLISSFPFYIVIADTSSSEYKGLSRISHLPRLYRLFKIAKLARILKLLKDQSSWVCCNETFGIRTGVERVLMANMLLVVSCHIVGCIWYLSATLQVENNWLSHYPNATTYELYIAAVYWTVQTVLTVGYGDIPAESWGDKLFAIIWMLLSVYLYSFAIGSLASLLERMDEQNQKYNSKLNTLKQIAKEFPSVTQLVFEKIRRELKHETSQQDDYIKMLNDLPNNLRIELGVIMHHDLIEEIHFFQDKPSSFVAFTGPLLTTLKIHKNEQIFMSGDPAEEMYFIKSGKVAAIIPEYRDFQFLLVKQGQYFGEIDFIFYGEVRKYTFKTVKDCEFYVLNKKNFKQVFFNEFREIGLSLLQNALERKNKMKQTYEEAIEFCKKNYPSEEEQSEKKFQKLNKSFFRINYFRRSTQFMNLHFQSIKTLPLIKNDDDSNGDDEFYEGQHQFQGFITPIIEVINESDHEEEGQKEKDFDQQSIKTLKKMRSNRNLLDISPSQQIYDFMSHSNDEQKLKKLEQELENKNKQLSELKDQISALLTQLKDIQHEEDYSFFEIENDIQEDMRQRLKRQLLLRQKLKSSNKIKEKPKKKWT